MKEDVVKIWLVAFGVFMAAALLVLAEPADGRFAGGSHDGYDAASTNSAVIPPPPEKGTVLIIQ